MRVEVFVRVEVEAWERRVFVRVEVEAWGEGCDCED